MQWVWRSQCGIGSVKGVDAVLWTIGGAQGMDMLTALYVEGTVSLTLDVGNARPAFRQETITEGEQK